MHIIDSFNAVLATIIGVLPAVLAALVVLIAGHFVAKLLMSLTSKSLTRTGIDDAARKSSAAKVIERVTDSPSKIVSHVVYWVVFLGAISLAVSVLGISALTAVLGSVYAYLPNVLAALLIIVAAVALSAAVGTLAMRLMGETPTGKMVAGVVPGVIMSIAAFMVLNQLMIAPAIVTITFAALIGAVALGSALAFGLGGRDVAARILESAYTKSAEGVSQARQDLQHGRENAQNMIADAKQNVTNAEDTSEYPQTSAHAQPTFGETVDLRNPDR